ncbi:MAG: T9SS type A sorting domain-containing protein [Chitinophagales bacterium]
MKRIYTPFLLVFLSVLQGTANPGFVKLLFGVEPKYVLEGMNKSAVVLTEGYFTGHSFNYIQQTDSLGNVEWLANLFPVQDTSVLYGVNMGVFSNGTIYAITHHKNGADKLQQKLTLIKNGAIYSTNPISNPDTLQPLPLRAFANTDDSCFIQVLQNKTTRQFYLQKTNQEAGIVWTKNIDKANFNANLDTVALFGLQHQVRIKKITPETYLITGIGWNQGAGKYELFQAIFNSTSSTFQYNHFQLPEVMVSSSSHPILFEEGILNAATVRIAVMNYNVTIPMNSYFISDINIANATRNNAYSFQDSSNNAHFPQRLYIDGAGNLFFLKPNSIYKRNATGDIVWNRVLFPDRVIAANAVEQDFVFMQSFTELSDSTFYIIGRGGRGFPNNICLCFGALIKANKNGVVYERLIKGRVYADDNKNCQDNAEQGLNQLLVEASDANASFYTLTDSTGDYTIPVENGNYTVKVHLNNTYRQSCTPSVQVNTLTDTTHADFAVQKQIYCPYLNVDVAIPFLRRCFDNTYQIHYSNEGTAIAVDAYVKIVFDSLLQVTASSIPWSSVSGNTYTFFLGDIAEQHCGDFSVTANLNCDLSVLGQTHCVQAYIYPDSLCLPQNPGWDGAVIQVAGQCIGDSVQFEIQNTGAGNMVRPKKYYVLEGDFLRTAPVNFQLLSGESKRIKVPANGNTITLLAEQSDNFPYPGNALLSIEACNGILQPGYVNHFTQNNSSPFVAINCAQNIGSYDPNYKTALPVGLDTSHFITNRTPLEYIVHFQNTGTDTAFLVIVTDTLSTLLDITTLKMGAASHRYTYQIEGNGVLKVYFNSIQLPDSATNTAASQGFFKFTIFPKNTLADYTLIPNHAAIYFDYNIGVATNEVFHTIKENVFNVLLGINEEYKKNYAVKSYPNPFSHEVTIELLDLYNNNTQYQLDVFDVTGKTVNSFLFNHTVRLNTDQWNNQLYLFTISVENRQIASGKLIKE